MNLKLFIRILEVILLLNKKVVIFNSGKKLFCSKVFKDTSVSDITKLAGIGVGTFYNYYPSKEKLFFEIHIQENNKLKKIRDDLDFEFILALFNSIIFIDTHKREIGIHHFPKIIDYLAEFIMKGLTDFPK